MLGYVKIRTADGPRLIEVSTIGRGRVMGWRVNRQGVRISRQTKEAVQEFFHIARESDIIAPMVMNLHYGELEPEVLDGTQ